MNDSIPEKWKMNKVSHPMAPDYWPSYQTMRQKVGTRWMPWDDKTELRVQEDKCCLSSQYRVPERREWHIEFQRSTEGCTWVFVRVFITYIGGHYPRPGLLHSARLNDFTNHSSQVEQLEYLEKFCGGE